MILEKIISSRKLLSVWSRNKHLRSLWLNSCVKCLRVRLPGKDKHFWCIRKDFQLPIFKVNRENCLWFLFDLFLFVCLLWLFHVRDDWWDWDELCLLVPEIKHRGTRLIKFLFLTFETYFGLWLERNAFSTHSRGQIKLRAKINILQSVCKGVSAVPSEG